MHEEHLKLFFLIWKWDVFMAFIKQHCVTLSTVEEEYISA